jgi:hypothetical protein
MRKSDLFFIVIAFQAAALILLFFHAAGRENEDMPVIRQKAEMVRRLELTDLCLFTEARYTRHVTQADLHTPFQDHPMALEHFPSGSLLMPYKGSGRL